MQSICNLHLKTIYYILFASITNQPILVEFLTVSFAFTRQPLAAGLYEPEGIYLSAPFTGQGQLLHVWGDHAEFYANYNYNGVPLQGYIGLAFFLPPATEITAVDDGRVTEISYERGGFEKYIKLHHRWGESLYAFLQTVHVEAGQLLERGSLLASATENPAPAHPHLHFAIRVAPYNRFDGWGGFTNPLPYLPPGVGTPPEFDTSAPLSSPPPMALEFPGMRRS